MAQGVGNLNVSVTADTRKARAGVNDFRKDLTRLPPAARAADRGLAGLSKSFAGLSRGLGGMLVVGLGIGGIGHAIRREFIEIDRIAKISDKLGIATEKLSGLHLAATETGVAVNKLDMGLQRMVRRIAQAATGSGEAVDALRELGLDAKHLNDLAPDEQFRRIADQMAGVRNQSDRVRIAFKLFDSEGVDLVNTLALGREGLNDVQEAAESLGLALSRKEAKRVEQANDAIGRMQGGLRGVAREAATFVAPAIEQIALAWENNFRALRDGLGAVQTIDQKRAATERLATATRDLQRAEQQELTTAQKRTDMIRDKQRAFDLEIRALERRIAVATVGDNQTRLDELKRSGLNDRGVRHFVSATLAAERAELIADQRDAIKQLRESIADFGKDPLVAERDRFLRNAATPGLAAEGKAAYDQLIAMERAQSLAGELPGLFDQVRDFFGRMFDGPPEATRRRFEALDANSAEGFAALRANLTHSKAEQQLIEQQETNSWLQQLVDAVKNADVPDVFTMTN